MAYNNKYFFTFFADRDTRVVDGNPDEYLCRILQLDFAGTPAEIDAVQNPVQINYQNTSPNKLEPIIGSECTLNLLATEDFELEDLYTENEREFMVEIYRKPGASNDINIYWSLNETPPGIDFSDLDLEIWVNGVQEVQRFTNDTGTLAVQRGDTILVKIYGGIVPTSGIGGGNIEITGLPTQRTTTYPLSIDTTFIIDNDTYVDAYSTWSATEYTALRSAVFNPTCNNTEKIVFTKNYTSTTSQAAAQSLADADTGFNAEGQAYANANAVCNSFPDLIWTGFIIPDGCQEAFTFKPYAISVNAVDGLGLLKNLSYVQNDGNFYLGKQSFIEVIDSCLKRIDAPSLILNTCVNIYDVTMTEGDAFDPLAQAYVNAERFLKDDQFTPMNCQEVLNSVLQLFTASIIQSDGEWYIYRPTELALNGNLVFRKYLDGERIYDSPTFTSNLNTILGGESEGVIDAPYFHINTDQLKMIAKPYKNASFAFKYGQNSNLLDNPSFAGATLVGPEDVDIPDWTKTGTVDTELSIDGGVIFYKVATFTDTNFYENDKNEFIAQGTLLKLTVDYKSIPDRLNTDMVFGVELIEGVNVWYLQGIGNGQYSWVKDIGLSKRVLLRSDFGTSSTSIVSQPTPADAQIKFKIYPPESLFGDIIYYKVYLTIQNPEGAPIGEIHTSTQTGKFTFVPETIDVLNGDQIIKSLGAIYGPDEDTLTSEWNRRGLSESVLAEPYAESKELLRIASEEKQRLYSGPFVQFEGSVFGYFYPVSRWSINLITGYYMNLSLNYDLQQNICKVVLGRVINEEIALDYTLTPDYGSTTKVTVKSTI